MLVKGQCFLYAVFFHWCQSKNNSMHHWWPDRKGLVSRTTLGFFCMSAFKRDMAVHVDHKSVCVFKRVVSQVKPFLTLKLWKKKEKSFPLSCTCRPLPSPSYFLPLHCRLFPFLILLSPWICTRKWLHMSGWELRVSEDKIRKVWFMETQNVRVTKK